MSLIHSSTLRKLRKLSCLLSSKPYNLPVMKKGIHPQVHSKATTHCATCSAVFQIPSTVAEMSIETCRMCHPIYTGKKQVDARGGRVERFKRRLEKTAGKK